MTSCKHFPWYFILFMMIVFFFLSGLSTIAWIIISTLAQTVSYLIILMVFGDANAILRN